MNGNDIVIEANGLTKVYRSRARFFGPIRESRAVEGLSFSIRAGERVAFLGPNGAGKSTTIKMLCGILAPDSGSARVLGHPAGARVAARGLGLVFGTRSQLTLHMTVAQCLDLSAEVYFLSGREKRERIGELSALFEIERLLDKRVRTLSLGERMRCEVVAALLHHPRVLLADEPTIGLDVVARNRLRELVRAWQAREGTTLLLTSHDLADVEALCERYILIDHGRLVFDGNLAGLKGPLASVRRLALSLSSGERADPAIPGLLRIGCLGDRANDRDAIDRLGDPGALEREYETDGKLPVAAALEGLSRWFGDRIVDIRISEVSLEEVLARLFREGRA